MSTPEHLKQHGVPHMNALLTQPSMQSSTTALSGQERVLDESDRAPTVLVAASSPAHQPIRSGPSYQGWGSLSTAMNFSRQDLRTQVECNKPTATGASSISWPSSSLPYPAPLRAPATVLQAQCIQSQACISHQIWRVLPSALLPGSQSSKIPSPLPLLVISDSPSGLLQGVQCKSTATSCGHSFGLKLCRKTAALVAGVLPVQHAMSQLLQEVCEHKLVVTRLQGASKSDADPSDVQQVGRSLSILQHASPPGCSYKSHPFHAISRYLVFCGLEVLQLLRHHYMSDPEAVSNQPGNC